MLNSNVNINNSWIEIISSKLFKNTAITPITILLGIILLIISAKIKVPLYPVPMTLQPLAVLMIAMLYGRNLAVITVGLYILQGCWLPVFAYGGGLGYIIGPTGGFIFGFFLTAFVVGGLADKGWGRTLISSLTLMLIGYLIIYAAGLTYFSFLFGYETTLQKAVYPFMLKDFYTLLFAGLLIPQIWKLT